MNAFETQLFGALAAMEKESKKPSQFDFDFAVLCYFKKYGKPATAKDLAAYTEVSIGRIREVIRDNNYECDCVDIDIPVREQNGGPVTYRRRGGSAYVPSRLQLLNALIRLENKVRGAN